MVRNQVWQALVVGFSLVLSAESLQASRVLAQVAPAISVEAGRQSSDQTAAQARWDRAMQLASQARQLQQTTRPFVQTWQQERSLWQQALASLSEIERTSELAAPALQKAQEYQAYLDQVTQQLETAQANFLPTIVRRSGLSAQTMITICTLSRECRRLRGDTPPASPASLIKVPVAVALMHKVTTENIDLDSLIYVNPGNFTEDAAAIRVGRRYSLRTLLVQMIARSSNIATNQLIDYLGQDYINQVLQERGYRVTRVNHKLTGASTVPINPGYTVNQITSDELTEMMVQIYNREHAGDDVIVDALSRQYDQWLGIAALRGSTARWLGEKTGQNSKALGTTLALELNGERYIITVIDNRGARDQNIRRCIAQISDYISRMTEF
ncbi:serine hydrolase [Leptolyngbya sp. FACHB-261]|uniref:serine hydrolase n=1 Tax=Leptolyngbya sp. FACHB-261 TaxID=2692806 RepID=UPI0016854030|nr:serine hydrolase [Leptolyngbya sp. FACHB-261]MBD2100071.1 serine hydrolase [Leptolyngbya sp. FACHB-261]